MKKRELNGKKAAASKVKEPIRTLLREEGKLLHGTRGKPTRGPRGNKR
jgi:hypothetical protein